MLITGFATKEGTSRYTERLKGQTSSQHFRHEENLWMSSIGIGTYLGEANETADDRYVGAIVRVVELGCNVIDTAANYRFQRSERSVGAALEQLTGEQTASRDELLICTKGGYLPFDGSPPANVRSYIEDKFVRTGIASLTDFVGGSHCMTPAYLESQLSQSLANMNLSCVDVYHVHNPESQLSSVSRDDFHESLRAAFAHLEKERERERIRTYGVATWSGFRVPPDAREYLSLERIFDVARDAGGDDHGFRFIQLPFNLAMPEALLSQNQRVNGVDHSVLEAASALGVTVIASASILQGRLAHDLLEQVREPLGGLATDAQTGIQFVRSTPGIATALVGMSRVEHVEENLQLARIKPASHEDYQLLFADMEDM